MLKRFVAPLIVAGLALAAPLMAARAQMPPRPVKVLFGFAAGGGAGDLLTRLMTDQLARALGQPATVDYRAGAGGKIALTSLKASPPDGTTLYIGPSGPLTIAPLYDDKVGYDPKADFEPIAELATQEYCVAVSVNSPIKSLAELVAWVKANPDKAAFGTPGAGTSLHFLGLKFSELAHVDLRAVHYRGSPLALNDVLAGQIPMVFNPLNEVLQQYRSGTIRVLATSGAKRSSFAPDAPTFAELGYDMTVEGWWGALAPAKTPKPIVDQLNAIWVAALRDPEMANRLDVMGFHPTGRTPAATGDLIAKEFEFWRPIVTASGFKAEN